MKPTTRPTDLSSLRERFFIREYRLDVLADSWRMTAQILAAELGNLIQDSKRKNTELRTAAEKALQDLKSLTVTSEAQLAAGRKILPSLNKMR